MAVKEHRSQEVNCPECNEPMKMINYFGYGNADGSQTRSVWRCNICWVKKEVMIERENGSA